MSQEETATRRVMACAAAVGVIMDEAVLRTMDLQEERRQVSQSPPCAPYAPCTLCAPYAPCVDRVLTVCPPP